MYSTNVESNATSIAPEVGIVDNVELTNISIPDGQEMLTFEFKQANGAVIRHTEFPANPDFSVDVATQAKDCSRRVKHIATKIMSEDEFAMDDVVNFMDYANKVISLFGRKYTGKKFRMVFHYKGKYVNVPKYPNFIENMETEPSSLYLSEYVKQRLVRVVPDEETSTNGQHTEKVTSGNGNDLPF